jgi:hypothetical protein
MAIRLYNKDSQTLLGEITPEQLQTLQDLLEEESEEDRDYYVDRDTLDVLAEEGADEKLLALIRPHVGEDEGIEIEWKRD